MKKKNERDWDGPGEEAVKGEMADAEVSERAARVAAHYRGPLRMIAHWPYVRIIGIITLPLVPCARPTESIAFGGTARFFR